MRFAHGALITGFIAALLWIGTGCKGELRVSPGGPSLGIAKQTVGAPGVQPGIHPQTVFGTLTNPYAGNAAQAAAGRRLFVAYNCSGCHGGHAGGGMGPSLRDSIWSYGNTDTQLFATINEGRPAGMPAWGGKLPETHVWELITYIRTLNTPREPDAPRLAAAPKSSTE